MKVSKFWLTVFMLPTLILFAAIYAIPLGTVIVTSFFKWRLSAFEFIGLKNYIDLLFNDKAFVKATTNTLVWVLLQSTIHVSLGALMGIILCKRPMGWKFVRTAVMLPNIISASALGLIYFNIFNPQTGLLNSILKALGFDGTTNWYFNTKTAFPTVTYTWLIFAGLVTIMVMAEIMAIDETIYEAAKIDGASGIQFDLYITLPQIKSIIATCVILASTSMLKEFELIYLTTNGGPGIQTLNLPLYLYKTSMLENNYGYANAIGTITIILGVVIILMIQKFSKSDAAQ